MVCVLNKKNMLTPRSYGWFIFKNEIIHLTVLGISNSYTMVCPSVRGDNPRALARGLSPARTGVQSMV